jgi:serine phosphatase RsbU (regulator of sigma subunit)
MHEAAIDELRETARFNAALARIGILVGSTLEAGEIMTAAVKETCDAVGAETAAIVMRRDGAWLTTYSYRFATDIIGVVLTDEQAPHAAMALHTHAPVAIDDAYEDPRVDHETMRLYNIRSVVTMPLIQEGGVVGVLFLNHHTRPVAFTHAQLDFLGTAATTISLALRNAELYAAQRSVADTLQQAMLTLPEQLPDVDFSCLYHSATESARVGGDFYDIFQMPGRRIGVAMGDVSGKGLPAAATAAMARNIVKAYALVGEPPADVLRMANEALRPSLDTASFVTLLFGVLDVERGTFAYSSGGHPPAFLLRAGRAPRPLSEGGTVLGPFAGSRYREESCPVAPGDTLVLYTDGVTEARGAAGLYGEQRLIDTLMGAPGGGDPDRLVEHLFFDVLDYAAGDLSDDLALLAVRVKLGA